MDADAGVMVRDCWAMLVKSLSADVVTGDPSWFQGFLLTCHDMVFNIPHTEKLEYKYALTTNLAHTRDSH